MTDIGVAFGRRIRAEREKRGWSARELGRRAGMGSAATISRAEVHGIEMSLANAAAVAAALGVSLDSLVIPPKCGTCSDLPPAGFQCVSCKAAADV